MTRQQVKRTARRAKVTRPSTAGGIVQWIPDDMREYSTVAAPVQPGAVYRQPDQVQYWTGQAQAQPQTMAPQAAAAMAALASSNWQSLTFETPTRQANPISDVLVPALQAVLSGAFPGLLVGVASAVGGPHLVTSWPWWGGVAAGGAVAGLVMAASWNRLLDDSRRLLRKVETITRRDLDGDGEIGDPQPAEVLRLEVKLERAEGAPAYRFANVPTTPDLFRLWARGAVGGRSLSQSNWTGKAGPFSRSDYEALMTFLEEAHIVKWTSPGNPAQGRELTNMGRAALRGMLGDQGTARAHAHASDGVDGAREIGAGVGE